MFEIERYTSDKAAEWNQFVEKAKNGTFLFKRNYMDYHADRFQDHSLMFYKQGRLYALLPANDDGEGTFWSHQGLTYGGLIMSDKCRAEEVCNLFSQMNDYLQEKHFQRVVYKHIPWIYASQPSEEDLFAITDVCKATIRTRDIASVVDMKAPISFSELRLRGARKAEKVGVSIKESEDISSFWQLLDDHLWQKFHTHPVHTLQEITLLKDRFPENIRLFTAEKDGEIVGGTLLYLSYTTVKTQYISANDEGLQCGALDMLFHQLLNNTKWNQRYFDFGTSNIKADDSLNAPLIHQKEGFGARAVCYDTYEWRVEKGKKVKK